MRLFLSLACAFATAPAFAAEFPPALFPGIAGKSEAEIRLAGVAALNPGRIFDHDPRPAGPVVPESRRTRVAELPRGGDYVRLYTLDAATLKEHAGKPLVVDCRYLVTVPEDAAKALALGEALTSGMRAGLTATGEYPALEPAGPAGAAPRIPAPVIVLVNRETAGPLESVLAALQESGRIFLVGDNTAGLTGVYKPLAEKAGFWIITGELTPAGGSLAGVGATPKFRVKVASEDEFLAWQLVERGSSLSGVLRRDGIGLTTAGAKTTDAGKAAAAHPEAIDATLQRAQDVLAALGVLGAEGK